MKNKELNNKLVKVMKKILINEKFEVEALDDNNLYKSVSYMSDKTITMIDSNELKLEDFEDYFVFINWNEGYNKWTEDLNIIIKNFRSSDYKTLNIFFMFSTLKDKIMFDSDRKSNKFARDILKKLSDLNNSIEKNDINLKTIFVNIKESDIFEIGIDNRIKSLEAKRNVTFGETEDRKLKVEAYVFSANLADIIEIYNSLGTELLTSNVRYGIGEEYDVDNAIIETLKTKPSEFWHLNNGITMVMKENKLNLSKSKAIRINYEQDKLLSVINGAQTISASAKFFYMNGCKTPEEEKELKKIKESARKNAKVMLRIICINRDDGNLDNDYIKACNAEINKISVSLNRQKPIKPKDIAYTIPFIYSINELKESNINDPFYFTISRRGEETNYGHDLVQFARAVKAYLAQKPGNARTQSEKTLLAIDKNDRQNFSDIEIFKRELLVDNNCDNIFQKFYKPVNFALKLEKLYSQYSLYERNRSKEVFDAKMKKMKYNKESIILNNGKWQFVAYVIYILNYRNNEDFSKFNADIEKINDVSIKKYIDEYVKLFSEVIENNFKLDSNDFKKNDIYNKFKDYIINGSDDTLKGSINEFNEKICTGFKREE